MREALRNGNANTLGQFFLLLMQRSVKSQYELKPDARPAYPPPYIHTHDILKYSKMRRYFPPRAKFNLFKRVRKKEEKK